MRTLLLSMSLILAICASTHALEDTQVIDFPFQGETLNGIYTRPSEPVKGIILIIHGYGKTDAVAQNWYADIRSVMLSAGYATFMWDKMGCGDSSGSFDINQPVQSSADEAIAAIEMLQKRSKPGASDIALWGISRAGWINPLIIQQYEGIRFWISWSGVDGLENFQYLLEQNIRINGASHKQASAIADEWLKGVHVARSGASYWDFKDATQNLAEDPFWLRFTNGGISWFSYFSYRRDMKKLSLDPETGLPIYINNFKALLSNVKVPVLAMFGENDMNVDWRKTRKLYIDTLVPPARLSTYSFPNCNHNLFHSETGGYYEFEDDDLAWDRCKGVLDTMHQWLISLSASD